MSSSSSKTVLITGCSTGIGRATAEHLARKGHVVYASARRLDSIADLESARCRLLALDVTDEASMTAAVAAVEAEHGAVDVLVNNAGYSQTGTIEEVSMADVRRQFETNVFGLSRMCQLVLPGMRARRSGRIVNVSSMGANFTFPGFGYYHATKYAVDSISDALRWEVNGFGIGVAVIQPGLIFTNFGDTAVATATDAAVDDGPYARFNAKLAESSAQTYERKGLMRVMGAGPEAVARTIERAMTARRPRTRYRVAPSARALITQRKLVTDRMWDRIMAAQFPRPG